MEMAIAINQGLIYCFADFSRLERLIRQFKLKNVLFLLHCK